MSNKNEETAAYDCLTQKGEEPTITSAPAARGEEDPSSIVVGLSTKVPRWSTTLANPTTLKWFVDAGKFPSTELATAAAAALESAAQEWNAVGFGIKVTQVTNKKEANFNLVYRVNPPGRGTVLARAFFPHQADSDVIVFEYGMREDKRFKLHNVFLHELGHVFGLRHEFAIAKEGQGAKLYGVENPLSVMAYNAVPAVQDSDKEWLREFYKLQNGKDIDGSPVTDYLPKLRSSNQ